MNNAHIKFTYWAEPRMSLFYLLLIIVGGIVLITLLVMGVFFYIIDCSIRIALEETVETVKTTFTNTIEEIEPGRIIPPFPSLGGSSAVNDSANKYLMNNGMPPDYSR